MDKQIAIISRQFSIVVKSVERGLADKGYNVLLLKDDISAIKDQIDETEAFILYLHDADSSDMQFIKNIILICDTFKDFRRRLILIGSAGSKEEYLSEAPVLTDHEWIDRPIDMDKLELALQKEIKNQRQKAEKKKLLIIDDDPFYAQMIIKWLEKSYNVELVTDGMMGISWLAKHEVDLILLDYEMPVVDGPKILEMLRMHPDTSSIPVIFLTGIGTKESIARVMNLKPQGYILKSTTNEELNKTLDEFFTKQAK